jgi:SAM-dependent methyltransferase
MNHDSIGRLLYSKIILSGMVLFAALFLRVSEISAQTLDVPYVTTPEGVVEAMLDIAGVGPGDYVIDLGSGDGRIVIAAARRGAVGHGIDIDPERVREAEENARQAGVADRVLFLEEDLYQTDFSRATVVTMYLLTSVNLNLRPELLRTLSPGTRVVSHAFDMGEWEPDEHILVDHRDVFFWVIPAGVEGQWQWNAGGEEFIMSASQEFQEVRLKIFTGGRELIVSDAELRGDRISFIARNRNGTEQYTYNGRIDGSAITGTVLVRKGNARSIENWTASTE